MSDNIPGGGGGPLKGADENVPGCVEDKANDLEGGAVGGAEAVVGSSEEGAVGGEDVDGAKEAKEGFFNPLDADDSEVTVIQSLCMNCNEQGVTRLMLTKIPFFRDVIVSSFECQHCGYANSEIDSANEISPIGVEYILSVKDKLDLERLVVKSDYCAILVPEVDLEIATKTQRGEVTTVEGVLTRVINGLSQDQERRKDDHEDDYEQIEEYLVKLEDHRSLKNEWTLMMRDVSGNSYIAPRPGTLNIADDPNMRHKKFTRTRDDDRFLGIDNYPLLPEEAGAEGTDETEATDFKDEVLELETDCPKCGEVCITKMKLTDIPFFKEVVIMATDCEKCGLRTNEVKSGGGIEPMGKRIKLKVESKEDLNRDVLKSDTSYVAIPELELMAGSGTIVGKFTTVEGLLVDIRNQLSEENPLIGGDSAEPGMKEKMEKFVADIDHLLTGEQKFTLILDDPAGNCYIQNMYAPDDDPAMISEEYERTFEQNEELGLNDMRVEDDDELGEEVEVEDENELGEEGEVEDEDQVGKEGEGEAKEEANKE